MSFWWLGWFAVARRGRGRGYGRAALGHVARRFRRVRGHRRIRSRVAGAGGTAGLRERDGDGDGWHTLECESPPPIPTAGVPAPAAPVKRPRRRVQARARPGGRHGRSGRVAPAAAPCHPIFAVPAPPSVTVS